MRVSVSVPDAITPGSGLWKLNLSVLNDPEYVSNYWFLVFLAHENFQVFFFGLLMGGGEA